MASRKCPICKLDPGQLEEFNKRVGMGLPASALADYLGTLGVSATPQMVYNHFKHSRKPAKPVSSEVYIPKKIAKRVSEDGLSSDQRQQRLLEISCDMADSLYEKYQETGSLRISRELREWSDVANRIIRDRQEREGLPEPNVQVQITLESLEESLGLPEAD
ncbi:hypothetical protein H6G74_15520 [Nostoc spongiaeforme FACHB-130]|uniref:Uncharacterized protein n=1 Tax=Nostoc spongiaeforme FACHB-130 TaxID=1357510 RepID=A0ABR8FWD4_9NOSO|nr:hypothetical protein [Nostoc spongiaeforme]MBD2595726.1 hypothetical protein [Nostoc spongiaeforme FACHB-130]